MPKVVKKDDDRGRYIFYCPGCKYYHYFATKKLGNLPTWDFNGDVDNPTFTPSLHGIGTDGKTTCHLFVRDGKIQFLGDCPHELAGQTVEMVDDG